MCASGPAMLTVSSCFASRVHTSCRVVSSCLVSSIFAGLITSSIRSGAITRRCSGPRIIPRPLRFIARVAITITTTRHTCTLRRQSRVALSIGSAVDGLWRIWSTYICCTRTTCFPYRYLLAVLFRFPISSHDSIIDHHHLLRPQYISVPEQLHIKSPPPSYHCSR